MMSSSPQKKAVYDTAATTSFGNNNNNNSNNNSNNSNNNAKMGSTSSDPDETIPFTPEQQAAYDLAYEYLHSESNNNTFLAPIPSVVSIQDIMLTIGITNNNYQKNIATAAAAAAATTTTTTTTVGSSATGATASNSSGNIFGHPPIGIGGSIGTAASSTLGAPVGDHHPNIDIADIPHQHRLNQILQHQQHLSINPATVAEIITLTTPTRGHHELYRALEQLEGLEKEESTLLNKTSLSRQLTEIVTGASSGPYVDSIDALHQLEVLGQAVPRRVCQHPFKKNDIVWVCRTCQADETCVLCHACFSQSNHDGHDVAFYHAQAGGCCDCGDPDAWDPAGFCPHHGPKATAAAATASYCIPVGQDGAQTTGESSSSILSPSLVQRVRGVVPSCIDWMVKSVAANAEIAYTRANPPKPKHRDLVLHKMPSSIESMSPIPTISTDAAASSTLSNNENNNNLNDTSAARSRTLWQRAATMPDEMMDLDPDNDNYNWFDDENNDDNDNNSDDLSFDSFPPTYNIHHPTTNTTEYPPAAARLSGILAGYHHGAHVFNPAVASRRRHLHHVGTAISGDYTAGGTSTPDLDARALILQRKQEEMNERALQLGLTGAAGGGLYLVLHADDIHSTQQLQDALRDFLGTSNYYNDTLLAKLVRAVRQYGQLVIWGVMELMVEVGPTLIQLWMDGDRVASTRIGAELTKRANRLSRHGLFCSIVTRTELMLEQRAVAVLQWLSCLARSCDPLCLTVAESILPNRHLVPLLRADFKMSARVTKAWYSLLLTLLAVPAFKSHLAAAYCDTYRSVTAKYARGMGVLERSGYTLSVQFLNRVTYVIDLVQKRDLLGKLGKSLLETLMVACRNQNLNGRLNPNHFVLTHRRYSPCVSDLKCVLNVKGMPRVIACKGGSFLEDWVGALSVAQFMDSQVWRHWSQGLVEDESRGWVGAFNASISLGSLFERLLGWEDDEKSPIQDPMSPLSRDLMSCVELTYFILTKGIDRWQRSEALFYESTPCASMAEPHRRSPASLPFSEISAQHGTALAMRQLPISQVTPFSFHLPLHRFVAGCLRELCLRKNSNDSGIDDLLIRLKTNLEEQLYDQLFHGLMEFSVLVLSRAAQVRANLWRRNGPGLSDQVLNYAEPPFCRNMRDADLLLTQFAAIGRTRNQSPSNRTSDSGMAFLTNLLLHRLGIFDFVGMVKAPDQNVAQYHEEVRMHLYPGERRASDAGDDGSTLPWTYSPVRETANSMVLLEEFLHFMIVFISELPSVVPHTREEQTQQAKFRLFREVIHRLASGAKTHSELSEVHHVLSHWDNVLLSEEGKLVNPDDATGAALGTVLADIADRKVSRGKMEPDKWEMRPNAWDYYDPAFFHISLRCHQYAAEGRPKPVQDADAAFGWKAKPYAPEPTLAHPFFHRLRRDATSDVSVLAITYRVLHMHCRQNTQNDFPDFAVNYSNQNREKSETALARTIHIITLGAYAWKDAKRDNRNWRGEGGGSAGSLFFNRNDAIGAPTVECWILEFLLAEPSVLLDCDRYKGEENALLLLQRLAVHGGVAGGFTAQDSTVRAGAAWLCEFALAHCPESRSVLISLRKDTQESVEDTKKESEMERRKQQAKSAAMAKMKAQAAKFASLMDVELGESEEEVVSTEGMDMVHPPFNRSSRKSSFGSTQSSSSAVTGEVEPGSPPKESSIADAAEDTGQIPPRLLLQRPRCIICNYEDSTEGRVLERSDDDDGEGQRKKSKRRAENALGFVGYAQASTVMKGGGGPPPDPDSSMSPVREFVGIHVALCGHAVHSECCESYLATVSHREDRAIGKRDEFRCPLCQRLSNCLVPFIDVGVDWIDSMSCIPVTDSCEGMNTKTGDDMQLDSPKKSLPCAVSLQKYLESTPWWVTRHNKDVAWDGQSAFLEKAPNAGLESDGSSPSRKPSRRIRSLKKKDLYAAWNAMMRTPRLNIVRRNFRRSNSKSTTASKETSHTTVSVGEESTGETIVWKRFMDQISDLSYRADSKRLGDDHLHDLFGEFRHYIVEKYAYNMANRFTGTEPTDWPSCLFTEPITDTRRQEMSREKLLSKLLLSIQAFTYSCCSEAFEARRVYRRSMSIASSSAKGRQENTIESICSRFGIGGIACDGKIIIMPNPSTQEDSGSWPFDGRLGRLRYFGLTVMAAAGAVAADLVQLALPFPVQASNGDPSGMEVDDPDRAPIAYPILFGNVLTHVVAATCATSGRARAQNDSLEVIWPVPFSAHGRFVSSASDNENGAETLIEDCEGFLKLGLLARMLQTLLGALQAPPCGIENRFEFIGCLRSFCVPVEGVPCWELEWIKSCVKLLDIALIQQTAGTAERSMPQPYESRPKPPSVDLLRKACNLTCSAACSFLSDAGTILQVLVPGIVTNFQENIDDQRISIESEDYSVHHTFEKLQGFLKLERVDEMLESALLQQILSEWYETACRHATAASQGSGNGKTASLQSRLFRTPGFRVYDWPSAGVFDSPDDKSNHFHTRKQDNEKRCATEQQPQDDTSLSRLQIESITNPSGQASTADILRTEASPALLTFSAKKCVPLLGGCYPDTLHAKANARPRVVAMPTSYTDLYAELCSLLPDCEQTAVCLICGEVLNAGGKGECTKHSYKCGAGAGMFFLLQECSGLIMHKSKAAYIHSPYVDSHGETPQYRGRPLNLDLDRYEHLREVWFTHGIRQKVVAERGSSRQVILPDFY